MAAIAGWVSANRYWILTFIVLASVSFLLLRIQVHLREELQAELDRLLKTAPAIAAERLENNRRLRVLFRRPVLELMKLDSYLSLGDDEKSLRQIELLEKLKLEPRDKLELYQRAVSFFAETGNGERAKEYCGRLRNFLKKNKAENVQPYASVYEEAELIIGVYVDRDTSLIKKLIGRAQHTKNDIMRGITQYRVAKLAYFDGNAELMMTYLERAAKNLKGTAYETIIAAALKDPEILETK